MIVGIGTDIVRTARLRQAVERWGEKFLRRVYTDHEISYAYRKSDPFLSLAARFAAKEAVIKAIGKRASVSMTDIEVVNDEHGGPSISPKGRLRAFYDDQAIRLTHVSLSHEDDYSIAFVVVEK